MILLWSSVRVAARRQESGSEPASHAPPSWLSVPFITAAGFPMTERARGKEPADAPPIPEQSPCPDPAQPKEGADARDDTLLTLAREAIAFVPPPPPPPTTPGWSLRAATRAKVAAFVAECMTRPSPPSAPPPAPEKSPRQLLDEAHLTAPSPAFMASLQGVLYGEPPVTATGADNDRARPKDPGAAGTKRGRKELEDSGGTSRSERSKCPHGRVKSQCQECGGRGICPHNRQKSRCKECGGSSLCEHKRLCSARRASAKSAEVVE